MIRTARLLGLTVLVATGAVAQAPHYLESAHFTRPSAAAATEGDILVVGGGSSAVVYQTTGQTPSAMTAVATLSASDGQPGDGFGAAVAISGDTVFVGSLRAMVTGTTTGAAYVFEKPPTGWGDATEDAKLAASDLQDGLQFGATLAVDGGTLAVGAIGFASPLGIAPNDGAVYLFERGASWASASQTARLIASDPVLFDFFGRDVEVLGDSVFASKLNQGDPGLYVFEKPAGGWANATETTVLAGSLAAGVDSVAAEGNTVAFSSVLTPAGQGFGAVYVFERGSVGWSDATQVAILTPSDAPSGQGCGPFGLPVALESDVLMFGMPCGGTTNPNVGAVYMYWKPASGWADATEDQKLLAAGIGPLDPLGSALALGSGVLFAAAALPGAVYAFEPTSGEVNTGCGLPGVTLAGSKRLGGTLTLSQATCSSEASVAFALGTPRANPIALPRSVACGDTVTCLLSCTPTAVIQGPSASVIIENAPGLVGQTFCVQGLCFEPACLRVTDLTSIVISQ